MKTILITGAAGFIGSTLAEKLLADGNRVIGLDNFSDYYDPAQKHRNIKTAEKNANYKMYRGDIENIGDIAQVFAENQISVVVHIAARAGVRPSLEDPAAYIRTNILGTMNVLDAMREHGVKKNRLCLVVKRLWKLRGR